MRIKLFGLALLLLATGCICLHESLSEHRESNEFWRHLNSEPRIGAILAHKPNKDFSVRCDNRHIIVLVNSPLIVERSFTIDKPDRFIPGNQYSPDELAVIEDAALDIKAKLGIERDIMIYDEFTNKEHNAKRLPVNNGVNVP